MKTTAIPLLLIFCACSSSGDDGVGSGTSSDGEPPGGSTTAATGDADDDGGTSADVTGVEPSSSGDEGEATATTTGPGANACEGATLREKRADPAARGPWPVGARTVALGDLTVEVWYPAVPGSEKGGDPVVYDIREQLPESEQGKISDADNPWQPCDCVRDLPLDEEYGPYPAIVFVHGTASFRTQSLPQMVHWASRGFVVLAADHPGLGLSDTLGSLCGAGMTPQDLGGDIDTVLAAIRGETGGLEFLGDRLDASRIGMAGHSAGGNAISGFGTDAQVLVPMAAGGTDPGAALLSTLVLGGTADSVVQYAGQMNGYASSPSPKRFVGIAEAGHLTFSEICSLHNEAGDDLLTIATDAGVCGAQLAGFLFQCSPDLIPDPDGWALIDYATAAVFEETLHCTDAEAIFAEIESLYPYLVDFAEG